MSSQHKHGFFEMEACLSTFDVEAFFLDRLPKYRHEAFLAQAKVDALRLRETDNEQRQAYQENTGSIMNEQVPTLKYRHPYEYAKRPIYWYSPDGDLIFPDGRVSFIDSLLLHTLLDGIKRNAERDYPGKKHATLFLRAGRMMKNRPSQDWFSVSVAGDWQREKFFWNRLQAVYVHANGFTVFLYATGNFWGEETNLQAMHEAQHTLEDRLKHAFHVEEKYKLMGDTPAQTGRELLQVSLPREREYLRLPDEIATLIYQNLRYQGRIETFSPKQFVLEDGVYILDGRWMYASCLSHLPVGAYLHDTSNEFAGTRTKAGKLIPTYPGFYHVTAQVPHNWQHIGLIKDSQPLSDTAVYPSKPDTVFSNWTSAAELALAIEHGWEVTINERLLWPETERITDPFATWIRALRGLRAQVEQELQAGSSAVGKLHKETIRSIVLQTIGSMLQVVTLDRQFTPYAALPLTEEPYQGAFQHTKQNGLRGIAWDRARPLSGVRQRFIHPEWAATVYGRARAKLAEFALRLPYVDIVSLRTDAIWCVRVPTWLASEDTGKPGCFRLENHIPGLWQWPCDSASMRSSVMKYHASKGNNEALEQEVTASNQAEENEE